MLLFPTKNSLFVQLWKDLDLVWISSPKPHSAPLSPTCTVNVHIHMHVCSNGHINYSGLMFYRLLYLVQNQEWLDEFGVRKAHRVRGKWNAVWSQF